MRAKVTVHPTNSPGPATSAPGQPGERPGSPGELAGFQPTHLVVHYNEVALKGKNRGYFESMLARNIRRALIATGAAPIDARVQRLFGRLLVERGEEMRWPRVAESFRRVFGIAHVLPAVRVEPSLDALKRSLTDALAGATGRRSFAIHCRRATKDLPLRSIEIQRELGTHVQALTGWPVDLDAPDLLIRVEIVNQAAFVAIGRVEGPGGLPTGVAGRVVALLSGGIDSPVAAWRLLRRGAEVTFVHFHSHPHTGLESQEKARALAELQRRIVSLAPAPLRVLLYRRFMMRAAEAIARREGALALVTGESLGQVASQTLANLRSIDAAVHLPVLRPLIGMDKLEIIEAARRIGTYETSIEPHGDCCSFLMPPNPATQSTPEELEAAEAALRVEVEVEALLRGSTSVEVGGARRGPTGAAAAPGAAAPGETAGMALGGQEKGDL